jgi:UDP-4-amino-4-deoxy-L-arabinose formyltransferase/UDP-glucuronic acid dehydrogenase (UDP-4-keto-hexauronic acid decarboxylating)
MDIGDDRIAQYRGNPRFHFLEGDIAINREWIEYHVKKCDVVLPLVAIATPSAYVQDPLRVFELDFEENLRIVRDAVRYQTRVVFPSTSEIYGMCQDESFNEETSNLVLGPISKQRWIYACSKQLLDRVIWAYGQQGLRFTLFRPFNWVGPNLDDIESAKEGSSRVVTQFLGHLMRGEPIRLVDGGAQRRCITDVRDGLDGLMRILRNEGGRADGRIFNLGNPRNGCSIAELADLLIDLLSEHDSWKDLKEKAVVEEVSSEEYYGEGYQDIWTRVPDIRRAHEQLGWSPRYPLRETLAHTIRYYVDHATL